MKKTRDEIKDFFKFSRLLIENPKLAETMPSEIFIPSGVKVSEILSEKRAELLSLIAKHPNKTINELSEETNRKKEAISRDINILKKHNLVRINKKGRQKQVKTSIKYVLIPISS